MFLLFNVIKYFQIRILSTGKKKNLFKKVSNVKIYFSNFWPGILKCLKIFNYFLTVSTDFFKFIH